ncbi:hypothetical protein K3729_16625 [Rhodobacteraceae bacterium S2214]|nr:hypothetical protein K3729_16625 [Rhodobacteraceae bacterium S2214]
MGIAHCILTGAGILALAACGSLDDLPPISVQEDAIHACAKLEGDAVFPIAVDILASSSGKGIASILPSERLSREAARRVNACARATAENAVAMTPASGEVSSAEAPLPIQAPVGEVAIVPLPQLSEVASVAPARVVTRDCPAGASVLFGGAGYCTGQ